MKVLLHRYIVRSTYYVYEFHDLFNIAHYYWELCHSNVAVSHHHEPPVHFCYVFRKFVCMNERPKLGQKVLTAHTARIIDDSATIPQVKQVWCNGKFHNTSGSKTSTS